MFYRIRLRINTPKKTKVASSVYFNNRIPQSRKRKLFVAMKKAKHTPAPTSINNKRMRNSSMVARSATRRLPGGRRLCEAARGLALVFEADHLPGCRLV